MKFLKKKKIFLAIETTANVFSLAVGDGDTVFSERVIRRHRHSERLVGEIKKLFDRADIAGQDLSAVGLGIGPGSFTGIRVGVSVAITFSQILNIPVYGISSLNVAGRKLRHPVIKAFRDMYYYARYDKNGRRVTPFKLINSEQKDEIGGVPAGVSACFLLTEIKKLFKENFNGRWQDIEPIYVMDTVYAKR